ncbi:MAG: pyridoxamine 5'-phosphate oxidase [bacterium]|nr:pyridoxamine 5'-phosphate oxidase [bacterium]
MDLENLRRSYLDGSLELDALVADPIEQFKLWFSEAQNAPAAEWFEPNAMTLASADPNGRVSARIVLLKRVSDAGFTFFTNYQSDKAIQFEKNPHAALVFYWPHIERQVRVEGTIAKTDAETSDQYFRERPPGSRLGAIASPQSRPLSSRSELEQATIELAEKYSDEAIPRPDYWGGYRISPVRMEFWQGRPSRLHDRFLYTLEADGKWSRTRLAP